MLVCIYCGEQMMAVPSTGLLCFLCREAHQDDMYEHVGTPSLSLPGNCEIIEILPDGSMVPHH